MVKRCRHCLAVLDKDEEGLCKSCKESRLIGGVAILLTMIVTMIALFK